MIGNRIVEANHKADKALSKLESHRLTGARMRGMLRKTRCFCSCWMCGHRRKHEGLTIQERKLELTAGDG